MNAIGNLNTYPSIFTGMTIKSKISANNEIQNIFEKEDVKIHKDIQNLDNIFA